MLILVIINPSTMLHVLLITELIWSTIYSTGLIIAILNDDLIILVISLFILGLSVVDVGLGFIITILQKTFINSDLLHNETNHIEKFYKQ